MVAAFRDGHGNNCSLHLATITYSHHKNTKILTEFAPNLLYYRCYIDDIFGIWVTPEIHQDTTWKRFESKLNEWGSLEWVIEKPSNKTVFSDLNVELIDSKIRTSTFQKSLNLHLYFKLDFYFIHTSMFRIISLNT
jgi:hypothetical protein